MEGQCNKHDDLMAMLLEIQKDVKTILTSAVYVRLRILELIVYGGVGFCLYHIAEEILKKSSGA